MECVESIRKNSYKNYEIVIVDNKSTDKSRNDLYQKKDEYSYTLIEAKENKGFSAGNNIGIRYALDHQAEYIVLLNNDTLVDTKFLSKLIEYQSVHFECAVAIGKIYYAYKNYTIWYAGGSVSPITTRTIHYGIGKVDNYSSEEEAVQVSFATGCYMSIRRDVFSEIGLLDEDYFLYDEDTDFSLRLAENNKKIFYIPSSVVYHKVSASTGDGSDLSQYYQVRNHFLLIKKNVKPLFFPIAIGYTVLLLFKRMFMGELKPKNVLQGTVGYLQGETKTKKL